VSEKLVFDCVAFSQNSHLHSRLVHAQWSLVPDQNFEKPSCQIPNFSNTLCIADFRFKFHPDDEENAFAAMAAKGARIISSCEI
jgi:hypothetical protein